MVLQFLGLWVPHCVLAAGFPMVLWLLGFWVPQVAPGYMPVLGCGFPVCNVLVVLLALGYPCCSGFLGPGFPMVLLFLGFCVPLCILASGFPMVLWLLGFRVPRVASEFPGGPGF